MPIETVPGESLPQELRAFAILPAAGAWDATPTPITVPHGCRVTLFCEYTEGAPTGTVDIDVQVSPHGADQTAPALTWFSLSALLIPAVAAGAQTRGQLEPLYINFDPLTVGREGFVIDLSVPAYVERLRARGREVGVAGTPGSLRVWATISPVDGAGQGLMQRA